MEDKFILGSKDIDKQHSKLFEMLAELGDLIKLPSTSDKYDSISDLLSRLERYTITHFTYEESLMKESKYNEKFVHMVIHAKFVEEIARYRNMDIDEQQDVVLVELFDVVSKWITNHVLTLDMKFVEWYNGRLC